MLQLTNNGVTYSVCPVQTIGQGRWLQLTAGPAKRDERVTVILMYRFGGGYTTEG